MSVISTTLRKYAALEDGDLMLQSVLLEAADELDRKDGLIDAIKFDTSLVSNTIRPSELFSGLQHSSEEMRPVDLGCG